ncbi:MAG: hypothetical protein KBH23_06420 [Bacteroidaceae bacterium]|nr:hypothetical protein [Bacteroidaceae bacterium]
MKKSFFTYLFLLAINLNFLSVFAVDAQNKYTPITQKIGDGKQLTYRYPDGKKHNVGFRNINEDTSNWSIYAGVRFEVYLDKKNQTTYLDVCFAVPEYERGKLISEGHAQVALTGKGWHTVVLPWNRFNIKAAQRIAALQRVKELRITPVDANGKVLSKGTSKIQNIELVQGKIVALQCPIRSKSAEKGKTVTYEVEVGNTTNSSQSVVLIIEPQGWESMTSQITPSSFTLGANETKQVKVEVKVSDRIPAGGRETQVLRATVNGEADESSKIELTTLSHLPHPYILHTPIRWQEIKEKVAHYEWAQKELDKLIAIADKWVVPELATKLSNDNTNLGMHLFQTQEENNLMAAGIAYQLTGRTQYAKKIALFMHRLSDPEHGYPMTYRGCNQSFVQEGHFFQHIAMAYDMALPSGVFSEEETRNVEHTFRLFIETVEQGMREGGINNWKVSEICGALYCALAIQDWNLVESMYSGHCGILDHIAQGVMNDGWWYECAIGYNVWCATEFSQVALALEPWGINLKDLKLSSGCTPYYSLMPDFMKPGVYGMSFEKWGPVNKTSVCIKDMWDAIPRFADYRGVMFGVNDAQETMLAGQAYELAYYMYRDPEYASIIRRGNSRDLLYGVAELPDVSSELARKSAYADNMGIVMLRSQKEEREQREQIQASLHYGTHGGYHGHFDRTDLLNMTRYGRSFFNPEAVWYGYGSYLYKFFVQTSMPKNMVVVDQKQQEPVESFRRLFYTGQMMQATMVESNARWSNPPYGGMRYDWANGVSFSEKMLQEGRSINLPNEQPKYGEVTDYSEPVMQRRLMVVTDDYVVLADYLNATQNHTYDCLFQMKGFQGLKSQDQSNIHSSEIEKSAAPLFLRHEAQMNSNPLSAAQFITDCNWWKVDGTARSTFTTNFGKDSDNSGTRAPNSEEGDLNIDVFSLWPSQKEIMVGTLPEEFPIEKLVNYAIRADGEVLASGQTGAWILGEVPISLSLKPATKQLELEVTANNVKRNTLFWGNARVVLADGREIPLSQFPVVIKNTTKPAEEGKDYYGGPIKIAGQPMKTAIPAMPQSPEKPSIVVIDLSGVQAVAFKTVLGGDFPLGNETARRKTYASRVQGKNARFITLLEPYETKSVIKRAFAISADKLYVELTDGRVQELTISGLEENPNAVKVYIKESKSGKIIREEQIQ